MLFPIRLEPHRPSWFEDFRAEAAALQKTLGDTVRKIDHMGSTSVGSLCAKPIIDLLAEVSDLRLLDSRAAAMKGLGYEVLGEFGIEGRRYYRKGGAGGVRTHHLHAFVTGSSHLVRHLAFRDYLRAHPLVAAEYGALKERLCAAHGADVEAYMAGKDAFIRETERRALDWQTHSANTDEG